METELSRDSVLGIMDFRYAPYALGDTFTWLTNLQIVAHKNGRDHIDIMLVTLPDRPSSRLQPQITRYNYTQSVEGLFPAFLCCPKLRSLRIYEKFGAKAQRIVAAMIARSPTWPSLLSHFCKELDYSTHRQINAFFEKNGWIPRLAPPVGYAEETQKLRDHLFGGRTAFVINIRQRRLTGDPAALHRDSAADVWRRFLLRAADLHPDVVFVLVGGLSEWERPMARLQNVVVPRLHGYGLGHELTLLLEGAPFIGSSSGFSAAATFSQKTPYLITNFEHQSAAYIGFPVGTARYPFAVGDQSMSWVPETEDLLLTNFERMLTTLRAQAMPA